MKIAGATSRINGLHVVEVTIKNLPSTPITMDAIYALGVAEKSPTGRAVLQETHGQCSAYTTNWSKKTMDLLAEMIHSMEEDLLPRHFETKAGLEDEDARFEPGGDEDARQI
jgi:hypothetical protein